jgi:hypothetical protein
MHSPDRCIIDFVNAVSNKSPFGVHAAAEAEKRSRPRGLRDEEFAAFRPLAMEWVQRGSMPANVLDGFDAGKP